MFCPSPYQPVQHTSARHQVEQKTDPQESQSRIVLSVHPINSQTLAPHLFTPDSVFEGRA